MVKETYSSSTIALETTFSEKDLTGRAGVIDKIALINNTVVDFSKQLLERKEGVARGAAQSADDEDDNYLGEILARLVKAVKSHESSSYFLSIQKWRGYVTNLTPEGFEARLEDLSSGGTDEVGEFERREVSPGDKELLQLGSVFYWSIGYAYNGTQVEKKSVIRFQRLNGWSEEEYDRAIDKGAALYDYFQTKHDEI